MISRIETDREDFRSEAIDLDAEGYRLMDMFAEEPYGTDGVVSALFRRRDEVVRLWYPVRPKGMMEKNGPSITVTPVPFSLSFTVHRMISHSSYFILTGSRPNIRCTSFTPA